MCTTCAYQLGTGHVQLLVTLTYFQGHHSETCHFFVASSHFLLSPQCMAMGDMDLSGLFFAGEMIRFRGQYCHHQCNLLVIIRLPTFGLNFQYVGDKYLGMLYV